MGIPIMTILIVIVCWALSTNAYSGDPRHVKGTDYVEYVDYLQTILDRDADDTLKLESLSNCSFVINDYWRKLGFLDLFWGRLTRETDVKRIVFSIEVGRYAPNMMLQLPHGLELVIDDPPLERYWAIAIVETEDNYLFARWSSEPGDFLVEGDFVIENDSSREISYIEVSESEVVSFIDSIETYYSYLYSTNVFDYPFERSNHLLESYRSHARPEFAIFSVDVNKTNHTSFVYNVWKRNIPGDDIIELHCFLDMLCSPNRWAPWICKGETWDNFEEK